MVDLLGRDSHSSRALHDGHVPIAPELNVFNPGVVQLEVEAGEDGRDCEIQFRKGKTASCKEKHW